jgi:multiple sugar transport system ATP-binding protein
MGEFGLTVNLELERLRGLSVLSDDGELPRVLADAITGRADFSGEIMLNGRRIDPMPARKRPVRVLGDVPGVIPGRTVRENLELALKKRALEVGDEVFLVEQELQTGMLAGLGNMRAESLDPAASTILAAARILLVGCDLLLIQKLPVPPLRTRLEDDSWKPGMLLDALLELKDLLRRHRATWVSLLTDPACVHVLSDRVAVFAQGSIIQEGSLRECMNAPASRLVADFLAFPRMNYRTVRVERDGPFVLLRSGRYGFNVSEYVKRHLSSREGDSVVLGIRPEDLRVSAYETGDPTVINLAKVTRVDAIPGALIVRLDVEGDEWLAMVEPGRSVFTGQLVELRPDPDKIHLFHPINGASLLD